MDFSSAAESLRSALRVHCYRMLGSASDSDDMTQETMLRAWRARESLADPARIKPWLFRIATNACLDELAKRPRMVLASDAGPPSVGGRFPPAPFSDEPWLEPMPDAWLAGVADDPAAIYTQRESVALAFIVALQVLSPAQRAVLVLRDVVGLSAEETAAALDQSVSATTSALHRARVAIEAAGGTRAACARDPDPAVVARYVQAIADHDLDAMIALFHDDMHTTMPPSPTWIAGHADNAEFYGHTVASWGTDDTRMIEVGVNGRTGLAFHRNGVVRAIESIETRDGKLLRVHHFMQRRLLEQFAPRPPS